MSERAMSDSFQAQINAFLHEVMTGKEEFQPAAYGYLLKLIEGENKGDFAQALAAIRADKAHDDAKELLLQEAIEKIYRTYPNSSANPED